MSLQQKAAQLKDYLSQCIIGQEALIERLLIALFADGHLLVEGAPGLAKTKAIKDLAQSIEGDFHRIQFTPDLLPSDITGTEIYRPQNGSFEFQAGPIFHNLVLADEINRSPAKVQAALLEAMGERQVSVGLRVERHPDDIENTAIMFFRRPGHEVPEQDLKLLKEVLDLNPEANEFKLEFGKVPGSKMEIAVLTRSMLQILGAMSMGVDAPKKDVEEGRTVPNLPQELRDRHISFVNIHSSLDKPVDAFVSVYYRNYWFWVADNDLPSKRILTFCNFLFSLAKSGSQAIAPVITVPAL